MNANFVICGGCMTTFGEFPTDLSPYEIFMASDLYEEAKTDCIGKICFMNMGSFSQRDRLPEEKWHTPIKELVSDFSESIWIQMWPASWLWLNIDDTDEFPECPDYSQFKILNLTGSSPHFDEERVKKIIEEIRPQTKAFIRGYKPISEFRPLLGAFIMKYKGV